MVFDLNTEQLQGLQLSMPKVASNTSAKHTDQLMQVQHDYSLLRYIDLCKHLNLDVFWPESFSLCILIMCRSTQHVAMANMFVSKHIANSSSTKASDVEQFMDVQNVSQCEQIISSISDFYNIFSFVTIDMQNPLVQGLEHNAIVKSMCSALRESKISTEKNQNLQLSLYALLFMSPRTVASGSMLERLLLKFDSTASDVELKCLRAMTLFRDALHDEQTHMNMLVTLCAITQVSDSFFRSLKILLDKRQQQNTKLKESNKNCRLMLRSLAQRIDRVNHDKQAVHCFRAWKETICFPISMGVNLQQLLYFVCAQQTPCPQTVYKHLFAADVISSALKTSLHIYDSESIIAVLQKVRLSMNNVKHLIDFRQRCLIGIDAKTRQTLTLPNILQLYIACYQHESIIMDCWQSVLPGHMNHITQQALQQFRDNFEYEVDKVVENLVRCMN